MCSYPTCSREKRAERRETEWIQFNYGIDLFCSSKSFFFPALSATCRGDVRQKRASVAYNERGTPFCFYFFLLPLSSFFLSAPPVFEVARERTRGEKKNANGRSTRVAAWNRLLTFLCRSIHVTFPILVHRSRNWSKLFFSLERMKVFRRWME